MIRINKGSAFLYNKTTNTIKTKIKNNNRIFTYIWISFSVVIHLLSTSLFSKCHIVWNQQCTFTAGNLSCFLFLKEHKTISVYTIFSLALTQTPTHTDMCIHSGDGFDCFQFILSSDLSYIPVFVRSYKLYFWM